MRINHNEIAEKLKSGTLTKAEAAEGSYQESEQDRQFINDLFVRLATICPAWKQSTAGMPKQEAAQTIATAKREWLQTLVSEGIRNPQAIDYALGKLKMTGNPFLPAVGQFVRWCQEGMLPDGCLSVTDSYKEVMGYHCLPREKREPQRLSAASYHTLFNLPDIHAWRHAKEAESIKIWSEQYKKTMRAILDGEELVRPAPKSARLEQKAKPPAPKETAMKFLTEARKGL